MQVYHDTTDFFPAPTALALGNFDGFHRAHAKLVGLARTWAEENDLKPAVFAFSPPALVKAPLFSESEKIKALENAGVEALFLYSFDKMRALSPEAFVRDILIGVLHARAVFCGFDYHFGKDRAGDTTLLEQLLLENGARLFVLPQQFYRGEAISSSAIRAHLANGDYAQAQALLGHDLPSHIDTEKQ